MKTQIIRRIFLVVITLFVCYNNNGSNNQTSNPSSSNQTSKTASSNSKEQSKTTASFTSSFSSQQQALPVIPEPNGDHEFHSFPIKDKHAKHAAFWKNIANKLIEAIYYIIVLIAYLPFKKS